MQCSDGFKARLNATMQKSWGIIQSLCETQVCKLDVVVHELYELKVQIEHVHKYDHHRWDRWRYGGASSRSVESSSAGSSSESISVGDYSDSSEEWGQDLDYSSEQEEDDMWGPSRYRRDAESKSSKTKSSETKSSKTKSSKNSKTTSTKSTKTKSTKSENSKSHESDDLDSAMSCKKCPKPSEECRKTCEDNDKTDELVCGFDGKCSSSNRPSFIWGAVCR